MKKIIYGESNFRKIKINNDYFYVDKTGFIEKLENLNESFLIFLRPRRFGKSLFLSTLQYYYGSPLPSVTPQTPTNSNPSKKFQTKISNNKALF